MAQKLRIAPFVRSFAAATGGLTCLLERDAIHKKCKQLPLQRTFLAIYFMHLPNFCVKSIVYSLVYPNRHWFIQGIDIGGMDIAFPEDSAEGPKGTVDGDTTG